MVQVFGNDSTSSKIFHKTSGKEISLSDFFSDDTYLSTLSEISRTKLHKKYPQDVLLIVLFFVTGVATRIVDLSSLN
jgi:hypothetical protein